MKTKAEVFQELIFKVLGKEVELQEVKKNDIQGALEKGTHTAKRGIETMDNGRNRNVC